MTTSPTAATAEVVTLRVSVSTSSGTTIVSADVSGDVWWRYPPEEPDAPFPDDVWCPPPQPTRPPLHRAPRTARPRMPRAPRLTSWLVEGRGR